MANFSLSVLQHGIARLIRKYGLLNCLNKWNRSSADLSSSQANNAQTFSFIYVLMIMVFKVRAKSNIIFWRNSTLLFGIVAVLVFERVYARGDIQTHRPECVWEGWVNKRERKGQPEFMCVWRQEEIQIIQRWSFGLTRSANAGTFKLMSKFFFSIIIIIQAKWIIDVRSSQHEITLRDVGEFVGLKQNSKVTECASDVCLSWWRGESFLSLFLALAPVKRIKQSYHCKSGIHWIWIWSRRISLCVC